MSAPQLTVQSSISLRWSLQDAQVFSTIPDSATLSWAKQIVNGTGLDQCDTIWHAQRTVVAGGSDNLNITGLPMAYFGVEGNIALPRLRGLFLLNLSTESGDLLVLDSSVANAYTGPFNGSTSSKLACGPDSPLILMNKKDGYGLATETANMLQINAPGPNQITYQIVLFGNSA